MSHISRSNIALGCVVLFAFIALNWGTFPPIRRMAKWLPHHGFSRLPFRDARGVERYYTTFVPYDFTAASKPPLLLFLNGFGENGADGLAHMSGPLGVPTWESKGTFPFVVVFAQCAKGGNWSAGSEDQEQAFEILDQVAKECHTDPDRVYLTGASSGGSGAWSIAAAFPRKFAAVVPLCGGGASENTHIFSEAQLPIWSFLTAGDQDDRVQWHRRMHRSLQNAGSDPYYTESPGSAHDVWNYAYRNPGLFEWMQEQSLSRNAKAKGRFVSILDGGDMSGWADLDEQDWSLDQRGELIGNPNVRDAECRLDTKREFKDFQLVIEFNLVAGDGFDVLFRSENASDASRHLESRLKASETGEISLYEAEGRGWLQSADPRAQRDLHAEDWNDFRLRADGDEVCAHLNGRKLFEIHDANIPKDSGKISFRVPAGGSVRWRRVQVREL